MDHKINKISENEQNRNEIYTRFKKVFSNNWALAIENCEVELVLEKDAPKIFSKAYTVPFGLRDTVEKELRRLADIGIIIPVKQ